MPLKKLGEKLKSSLHHFSPKNKKGDDATEGGDLSPCNLPPSTATQENPLSHYSPSQPETVNCNTDHITETEKQQPQQPQQQQQSAAAAGGCFGNNDNNNEQEQTKAAAATAAAAAAAAAAGEGAQVIPASRVATPRYEESADIFPTMYYKLKTEKKETIEQSVLLVNPSRSDKEFSLRLAGSANAKLEKDFANISGDFVERVTVTITPEKETEDVYIDLLQGGYLYDKIRVSVSQQ